MTTHDRTDHAPEPLTSSPEVWDAEVAEAEAAIRADAAARAGGISRRAFLAGAAAALPAAALLGTGLAAAGSRRTSSTSASFGYGPSAACKLPPAVLARFKNGWDPQRSADVVFAPHGWNYLSGAISHSTPWHYTQDVPMFWYGPGIINARGSTGRYVTSADIAPTIAKLVNFPFDAPDGTPMDEAIKVGHAKPKLIVVLVWDAGGKYVLGLHPGTTPHLQGLIPKGTSYANATVGSNPSNTAPIHATIGTGAHPVKHGVVDNTIRFADGHLGDPWSQGPGVLKIPTLADEYAKAMGSKARTAMFGTLPWHLGMVGQGANLAGGVKHIVVLRDQTNGSSSAPKWAIPSRLAPYYRFPAYVNDSNVCHPLPYFTRQWADLLSDNVVDGKWRGHSIQAAQGGFHTPARVPYQTEAIQRVISNEHLGQHEETDLLFLNYKIIDEIGHEYFADSAEMGDTIKVQDQFLQNLVSFLETHFHGKYALCVTADHGHTAHPSRTGGVPLLTDRIHSLLEANFDADGDGVTLAQDVRPTGVLLNRNEVRQNHTQLSGMAKYLSERSVGDLGTQITGSPNAPAFDAVFSGSILPSLTCS
jgi:hypothetical protein